MKTWDVLIINYSSKFYNVYWEKIRKFSSWNTDLLQKKYPAKTFCKKWYVLFILFSKYLNNQIKCDDWHDFLRYAEVMIKIIRQRWPNHKWYFSQMFSRKVQKQFRKAKNILDDLSNKHKPLLLISDQSQVVHQWLFERSDYISSHNNKSN